jgi:hypothetical protein
LLQRRRTLNREGAAIEPFRTGADAVEICAGDTGSPKNFVDGIKKCPGAMRVDGNVAIEFAGCREYVEFSYWDGIFEPVPVFGLVGLENESCFAVGVIVIPGCVTESLVYAVSVERNHECLDGHAGMRGIRWRVGPGGEPAAVVKLGEDSEVGDDAGPEIAAGTGQDFGNDGVVDIDVEGGFAIHGRFLRRVSVSNTDGLS